MKKIIAVSLVLALSGCGDDNDMALKRQGMIGSDVAIPNTSKPNKPDKLDANWKYSSIASGSKVLSLSATTYSLNTYPKPENKKGSDNKTEPVKTKKAMILVFLIL